MGVKFAPTRGGARMLALAVILGPKSESEQVRIDVSMTARFQLDSI
jgi:hypothetical protein